MFGCVLDWDFDKKLVVVSLAPELVAARRAVEAHKGKQKKVELLKIVLTKLGNTKVLDIRSVTSHTAVTCVVTQHSLKVLLMLHACRFCRTFFFSSLDCWQSVFLSKFSEEYEARRFSLKGNGTRHTIAPFSRLSTIPPFCFRDN